MSNSKKNSYRKKSSKAAIMSHVTEPAKGNVTRTLVQTGADLLVGVIGGGFIGSAIGKPSLLIGAAVTAAGHYTAQPLIRNIGFGMMAANGFQKDGVNGLDGLDGMKDRVSAYKTSFMQKLYLDKFGSGATVAGLGEMQYFSYPAEVNGAMDFSEVNGIEEQIQGMGLARLPMSDGDELQALSDASDFNY